MPSLVDDVRWPVRTERLLLRPAEAADAEATWRYRRLDSVSRWLTRSSGPLEDYRARFVEAGSLAKSLVVERDGEVLRVCFEDLGLRRVTAECFATNEASWRLMERVGMRREAHSVRDSLHRSGEWMDGLGYALLADEWRRG